MWHESGYPAHGDYRNSNRLTARAHALWANDGTLYEAERAAERARADAADFVANVPDGTVVAFDTELFGHHWHEGITFLQTVLELADVLPVALGDAEPAPDAPPTSWGLERDLRTWSRGPLAWTQRGAELAALGADPSDRALRELLALQSLRLGLPDRPRHRRRLPARARRSASPEFRLGTRWTRFRRTAQSGSRTGELGVRAALTLEPCMDPDDVSVHCRRHKSRVPSGLSGGERGNRMEPWSGSRGESPS